MLALRQARAAGFEVRWLLAMLDESGLCLRSHGVPLGLMQAQAAALGLELVTPSAGWDDYQTVFTAQLRELAGRGAQAAVFGDIDLQPHRDWEEQVCAAAGLRAELPLWGRARSDLARAFIALGYSARVVCVDSRYLPDSFCGRLFDAAFIDGLPPGVDACGENGEFHTFVFDGPEFAQAVAHAVTAVELHFAPVRFGGGRYVFARLERADAA
ncbi:MAG: adenine nucleotide alpha hydrolase [Burkholderiales bacterium]|nr:adenine nucleotide alpha hydrolase [Burkholderiales bacterium]